MRNTVVVPAGMRAFADMVLESIRAKCPELIALSREEFIPYTLILASALEKEIGGLVSAASGTREDELDIPGNKFSVALGATIERLSDLAIEVYWETHGHPLH